MATPSAPVSPALSSAFNKDLYDALLEAKVSEAVASRAAHSVAQPDDMMLTRVEAMAEFAELKTQVTLLTAQINTLESQFAEFKAETDTRLTGLETRMADLDAKITKIQIDSETRHVQLQTEIEARFAQLQTEGEARFAQLQTEGEARHTQLQTEMAQVKAEFQRQLRGQLMGFVTFLLLSQGAVVGLIALLLR